MIVTVKAGSVKSFLIDSLRQLLSDLYIVCYCFGTASFDIQGKLFMKLSIKGKRCNELKRSSLNQLKVSLVNENYLIIVNFPEIDQKLFG